jgi:hypothetical protein
MLPPSLQKVKDFYCPKKGLEIEMKTIWTAPVALRALGENQYGYQTSEKLPDAAASMAAI